MFLCPCHEALLLLSFAVAATAAMMMMMIKRTLCCAMEMAVPLRMIMVITMQSDRSAWALPGAASQAGLPGPELLCFLLFRV